ncbi:MAG: gamma carbonic anhydrase family protein [Calditrichales bacterium]|nr:MAG: gamma carbonic anhydrase family protein [Calditrichales bacterium]
MIYKFENLNPHIGENVFIAPSADIIGDVTLADDCSIWFNVTVRGDVHYIKIGKKTNIQDNSVLHVTNGIFPLNIGEMVTVGHGAILHGCTIGNNALIGMGAVILDGAEISDNSIVAAGSLVREGQHFPEGILIAGSPARVKRKLRDDEIEKNLLYARNYLNYKTKYMDTNDFKIIEETGCE